MVSSTSERYEEFDPSIYMNLSLDKLVAYAVYRIINRGETCTFEKLVVECFKLFPKAFSLRLYPQYPDSARVNKSWLRCRTDKGWITGNVKIGFKLTEAGLAVAKQTEQALRTGITVRKKRGNLSRARERGEVIINFIKGHPVYRRYKARGENFCLTEQEFRHLLACTMEAPITVLKQNLKQVKNVLKEYGEMELLSFIEVCEKKMKYILKRPMCGGSQIEGDKKGPHST